MNALRKLLIWRARIAFGILCLALTAAGCGPGFKTVPVSGKVFVNGEPLTGADATVFFKPDASKGNSLNVDFSGVVDENGNYTLYYGRKGDQGVAPGWYKVAVTAIVPLAPKTGPDRKTKARMPGKPVRITLIDNKYSVAETSGIEIQVVENPAAGAYDLQLKGPPKNQP
jgi:hypothetical protein